MNDYVIPLPNLKFDKEKLIHLFGQLDFRPRWEDRPTNRYVRANLPDNIFDNECVQEIKSQIPHTNDFQFIKIVKNWEMPIHIDTYRTAVIMIILSENPAPTFWYNEPDHIKKLRLSGDRDLYIKESRKLNIKPIYEHHHDGSACVINSTIPHNTNTRNDIDRLTIQIGYTKMNWSEITQLFL